MRDIEPPPASVVVMKMLVGLMLAVLLVVGLVKVVDSPSTESRARQACEHMVAQCDALMRPFGEAMTEADLAGCIEDVLRIEERGGDALACVEDADSCGQAMECTFD